MKTHFTISWFLSLIVIGSYTSILFAQADSSAPTADAVKQMLESEPFSEETWPAWRKRLLDWVGGDADVTAPAYDASRAFTMKMADANGDLPGELAEDYFAYYTLGAAYMRAMDDPATIANNLERAEKATRRSIALQDDYSRSYRNLALILMLQQEDDDAERQLRRAAELDPELPLSWVKGQAAAFRQDYATAILAFRRALVEEPDSHHVAVALSRALLAEAMNGNASESGWADVDAEVEQLQERFPKEGRLPCVRAIALAQRGQFKAAAQQLKLAAQLGTDPKEELGSQVVEQVYGLAAPGWIEIATYIAIGFAAVYSVVIVGMVLSGLALGSFTRGVNAVRLLGQQEPMVHVGKVTRTHGESLLARLYGLALMGGLVMFYAAIPFIVVGLVAVTGGMLYAIFMLPRIPVKLILVIAIVGLGMAWGVFKSLFTKFGSGGFGIELHRANEPKLYATMDDVARAVDTEPVHQIYLAPGSEIGVHQEGRGPFGMFGIKSRVLTLGMASLNVLSVDQLRSIMAHEYAHFSHGDTFYSRFIQQVTISIEQSLIGMGKAGGWINYVNPFYWFMYCYYRAFMLMSAGFSRSREFLADRMAVSLYGQDVFSSGLLTVATEAAAFEGKLHEGAVESLRSGKMISNQNLYQSLMVGKQDLDTEELRREIMADKGSAFASHPTISERLEAVQGFPNSTRRDDTPAAELLVDPAATETEASKFLREHYLHMIAAYQAQQREYE